MWMQKPGKPTVWELLGCYNTAVCGGPGPPALKDALPRKPEQFPQNLQATSPLAKAERERCRVHLGFGGGVGLAGVSPLCAFLGSCCLANRFGCSRPSNPDK